MYISLTSGIVRSLTDGPEVQQAFLPFIAQLVISFVLSMALAQKQKQRKQDPLEPPNESDLKYTRADTNNPVPLLFGTFKQDAPNIIRTKDYQTTDVTSGGATVGHNYFYWAQYALCYGPIDKVTRLYADKREIWPRSQRNSFYSVLNSFTANDPVGVVLDDVVAPNTGGYYKLIFNTVLSTHVMPTKQYYLYKSGHGPNSSYSRQAFEARGMVSSPILKFSGTYTYGSSVEFSPSRISVVKQGRLDLDQNLIDGSKPTVELRMYARYDVYNASTDYTNYYYHPIQVLFDVVRVDAPSLDSSYIDIQQSTNYQSTSGSDVGAPNRGPDGYPGAITEEPRGSKAAINTALTPGQSIYVRDRALHDGEAGSQGAGGVELLFTLSDGSGNEARNVYNNGTPGTQPAYRNIATLTPSLYNNYYGRSSTLPQITAEVQRIPRFLDLTEYVAAINGKDANPALCLYECLVDPDWGLGIPISDIDEEAFQVAAKTLYTEGHGYSRMVQKQTTVDDLMAEIEAQIDGMVYMDRTGKWTIRLIRDDYDVDSLTVISDANILEVSKLERQTHEDPTNSVTVAFPDRDRGYETNEYTAFDQAALAEAGQEERNSRKNLSGVTTLELARQVAQRMVRQVSTPQAVCTLTVDRSLWFLEPGQPVVLRTPQLGLDEMVMRVTKVNLGTPGDDKIKLTLAEDIFTSPSQDSLIPFSTDVLGDLSTPISALDSSKQVAIEAPKRLVDLSSSPLNTAHRVAIAGGQISQLASLQVDVNGTLDRTVLFVNYPATLSFALGTGGEGFLNSLLLSTDNAEAVASMFVSNPDPEALDNLILVNDELMLVGSATVQGSGVVLSGVHRAVLDTIRGSHDAGASVFLLKPTKSILNGQFNVGDSLSLDIRPAFGGSSVSAVDSIDIPITIGDRYNKPYPPSAVDIQGQTNVDSDDTTFGAVALSNNEEGIDIRLTRRSYRSTSIIDALTKDADEIDPGYLAEDSTNYTVSVYAIDPTTGERAANNAHLWTDDTPTQAIQFPHSYALAGRATDSAGNAVSSYGAGSEFEVEVETSHITASGASSADATLTKRFIADASIPDHDRLGISDGASETDISFTASQTGTLRVTLPYQESNGEDMHYDLVAKVNGTANVIINNYVAGGGSSGTVAVTVGDDVKLYFQDSGGSPVYPLEELSQNSEPVLAIVDYEDVDSIEGYAIWSPA